MLDLTPEQKLVWLGLKASTEDGVGGGGGTPINEDGEPLAPEDGDGPLAGIRVHREPGTSYDGIQVPAGTTEVYGTCVEFSDRNPVPESETPDTEPVPDPPVSGDPGGGEGIGNPPWEFSRTVDGVEDLGMDNTGSTPIDDQLDYTDGTEIVLPEGDYLIQDTQTLINLSNWGLRGKEGNTRDQVNLRVPDGNSQAAFVFGNGCQNIYWANFTLDQRSSLPTSIRLNYNGTGDLYAYNLRCVGKQPNALQAGPPDGDTQAKIRAVCADSSALAQIINFEFTAKTDVASYPQNTTGIASYRGHRGTLRVENAHIENRGEHAVRANAVQGATQVVGGLFKNNCNTNMRICGANSYLKDATVVVDMDPSYAVTSDTGENKAIRGMWWESGPFGKSGGYVENCEFIYTSQTACPGVFRIEGTAGQMEIRDSTIRNENNGPTVFVERIGSGPGNPPATPPKPWDVTLSNVTFEGGSSSPPVSNVGDRTVRLEDCTINMPNAAQSRGVTR